MDSIRFYNIAFGFIYIFLIFALYTFFQFFLIVFLKLDNTIRIFVHKSIVTCIFALGKVTVSVCSHLKFHSVYTFYNIIWRSFHSPEFCNTYVNYSIKHKYWMLAPFEIFVKLFMKFMNFKTRTCVGFQYTKWQLNTQDF